jgi:hypothetical protein
MEAVEAAKHRRRGELATLVLSDLIRYPKTSRVESQMLNTWPGSMGHADLSAWGTAD